MSDTDVSTRPANHSDALHFPAEFALPISAVIRNVVTGLALVAFAGAILLQAGNAGMPFAVLFGVLGVLIMMRNLQSLHDPEQRKLIVHKQGIEIRYGSSQRYFPFVDYGDYRISRGWFGDFLSAAPIEAEWRLPPRIDEAGTRRRKQVAILAPAPPIGGGAPASLLEWQSMLNDLRRDAVGVTGLTARLEAEAREQRADEAERLAEWRVREGNDARASRRYLNNRLMLWLVSGGILLSPLGLGYAWIWYCGRDAWTSCVRIDPDIMRNIALGGAVLGLMVLKLGGAWLLVRRAHDLDEDLRYWPAFLDSFSRGRTPLQRRLSEEDGTVGTNRFGPEPLN